MPIPYPFDFKNPDYHAVFEYRRERLARIRENPSIIQSAKEFYKDNPAQFIIDWGCTYDFKNVKKGQPSLIPFILYPRQVEWIEWLMHCYKNDLPGLTEKARQTGMSWLSIAAACTLSLFNNQMHIGFGSKREIDVDSTGSPKSLFYKARCFLDNLPNEFTGGWSSHNKSDSKYKLINININGSKITADSGDNLGRSGTYSIFFVDEAAFLERPELAEASLSQATPCRIDISTPKGMANPFAEKRHSGQVSVFSFPWTDDPTKDYEWYQKQVFELDPVTLAQEVDMDYSASVSGIVIPATWVRSALDAHLKLGVKVTGKRLAALDVADEGKDLNAVCGRYGILIDYLESWSGKGSDIYSSVDKALQICSREGYNDMYYDADGVGAGVKGDAKRIIKDKNLKIAVKSFRGSGSVVSPLKEAIEGRKNQDFFGNFKAQSWWMLRKRFQATFRAVAEGLQYDENEIISISSSCSDHLKLLTELSQPTFSQNGSGKIIIDKMPNGSKSPNLADSVMMAFSPIRNTGDWSNVFPQIKAKI